ncbi:type II toxin-antitoxin system PemK/MazF family toxin [Scytonema hofmannii]|nr:type II toxin-antitoxin system PemK/MazF family toxin [Scytonema hofmannii]
MSIQRGQIYLVNLNPVQGREQAGTRPVLGKVYRQRAVSH